MPALQKQGIFIHDYAELSAAQLKRASKYFDETIFPVLTRWRSIPDARSRTFPT